VAAGVKLKTVICTCVPSHAFVVCLNKSAHTLYLYKKYCS
jgi:hypothetical protein